MLNLFQHTAFDPVTIDPTKTGEIIDTSGFFWWGVISVVLCFMFFIICGFIFEKLKETTLNNVIAGFCFILALLSLVSAIVAGINHLNAYNANKANDPNSIFYSLPKEKYNIEGTQEWAEQTYLVKLTKDQAKSLIYGRTENFQSLIREGSVRATYYGENVLVQLIQVDDDWTLFMNDKELPKTTQ